MKIKNSQYRNWLIVTLKYENTKYYNVMNITLHSKIYQLVIEKPSKITVLPSNQRIFDVRSCPFDKDKITVSRYSSVIAFIELFAASRSTLLRAFSIKSSIGLRYCSTTKWATVGMKKEFNGESPNYRSKLGGPR